MSMLPSTNRTHQKEPPRERATAEARAGDRPLTTKMREALKLLGTAWLHTGTLTTSRTQPCAVAPDVPWINHATGRALARAGLVEIEHQHRDVGPDEISLTDQGERLVAACRQCGRTELDVWPDGLQVVLVGCDICGAPACDEHCALSEGEWCCTDHEPDAGWDPEPGR